MCVDASHASGAPQSKLSGAPPPVKPGLGTNNYIGVLNECVEGWGRESGRVFHAPFLQVNPGFTFYSVWEREKNLAAALYPSVRTCRTLDELLTDKACLLYTSPSPRDTR